MTLGIWDHRLSEKGASEIIEYGVYLGRTHYEKDCYWACYLYDNNYYIGLNGGNDMWLSNKKEVDLYCEVPNEEIS